jgi:REP-associated tyrosine transposase
VQSLSHLVVHSIFLPKIADYIANQAEHHRKFTLQEEVRELLKRHRVAFDERYLWD